jgi:hypothetical protein
MLCAFNRDILAEDRSKDFEFFAAQSRTRYRRRTDRAVFLDQEERPVPLRLHFSHVPFVRAHGRQCFYALLQGILTGHLLAIGNNLLAGAHV